MLADSFPEKTMTAVERPQSDEDVNVAISKKAGTVQDRRDMWRIGRDQELNVCHLARPFFAGIGRDDGKDH